ncbi:unnamed protein product, partial [Phaeothamnion confervicola]
RPSRRRPRPRPRQRRRRSVACSGSASRAAAPPPRGRRRPTPARPQWTLLRSLRASCRRLISRSSRRARIFSSGAESTRGTTMTRWRHSLARARALTQPCQRSSRLCRPVSSRSCSRSTTACGDGHRRAGRRNWWRR